LGYAAEVKALDQLLAKNGAMLDDAIKELETASAVSSQSHTNAVAWSVRNLPSIAPIETTSLFNSTSSQPWPSSPEITNAGMPGGGAGNPESSPSSEVASSTLSDGEIIAFADDLDKFPHFLAVHSSHGDLEAFLELTKVVNDEEGGVDTGMRVRRTRRETQRVSINASESAYLLGYCKLGKLCLRRWNSKGFHHQIRH
jgi:hypothetical protein